MNNKINEDDIEYIKDLAKDIYNGTVINPEKLSSEVRQNLITAINKTAGDIIGFCNSILKRNEHQGE